MAHDGDIKVSFGRDYAAEFGAKGAETLRNLEQRMRNLGITPSSQQKKQDDVEVFPAKQDDESNNVDTFNDNGLLGSTSFIDIRNDNTDKFSADLQSIRAQRSANKDDLVDTDAIDQIVDVGEIIADQTDTDANKKLINLDARNGFHGIGNGEFSFEHDLNGNGTGTYYNVTANVTYKSPNGKNIFAGGYCYERGQEIENEDYSEILADNSDEIDIPDSDAQNVRRLMTRAGSDIVDPDPPIDPPKRTITNVKSYDAYLMYKGRTKIGDIGAGFDMHNHDDGDTEVYNLRGVFRKKDSDIGAYVNTSWVGAVDDEGNKTYLRDTKVGLVLLDNNVDNDEVQTTTPQPSDDGAQTDDPADEPAAQPADQPAGNSDLEPEDDAKVGRLGLELVAEDDALGIKTSYRFLDNAVKNPDGSYKISQFFFDGAFIDETADNKDKLRFTSALNFKHENVKPNGNILKADANISFRQTFCSGEHPDRLLYSKASFERSFPDRKSGYHSFRAGAQYVNTLKKDGISFGELTAGYDYVRKNFKAGAELGASSVSLLGERTRTLTGKLTVAYSF